MQDEYLKPSGKDSTPDPIAMIKTANTKSFKYLLRYALPYTVLYVFLPSLLSQLGLPLSNVWLSTLVLIVLNVGVIVLFQQTQKRGLEKIECHRIGLLTTVLTLFTTSLLMIHAIYDLSSTQISFSSLKQDGVIPILVISGAIGAVINYIIIAYGLWVLQKLIFRFRRV